MSDKSLDGILEKFTKKFGEIPEKRLSQYSSFVANVSKEDFHSRYEQLDYILLFSYVIGDREIVDRETGEKRTIQGVDDLTLLSIKNLRAKNNDGIRINPELYKLHKRREDISRRYNSKDYKETLNSILQEPEVIEHLGGKTSYSEDVKSKTYNNSQKEDMQKLRQYVMGEIPIVDRRTGKERTIQSVDDLILLSCANVLAKNKRRKRINQELSRLYGRIQGIHIKNESKSYKESLDSIFQESEVIEHLGRQASYSKDIKLAAPRNKKYSPKEDLQRLKQYVVGEIPIVDRETGKERTIQSVNDLTLLSYANINAKDQEGKRRNPDLFRLRGRIQVTYRSGNSKNYEESLDSIFQEPEVIDHLGRQASYSKEVKLDAPRNKKYPPKEDLQRLKQYVVGEIPIVDRETGKERTIQSVDDLILLSSINIKAKDEEGKRRNTELFRVFIRIENDHSRINSLGYNEVLDRIFKEPEVIEHLGRQASYSKYVRLDAPKNRKYPPKEDLQRLKQYVVGEIPIVDRETGKERTIQSVNDLILLSCANLKAKDKEGKRRNTELYRISKRIENDHSRINSLGYNEVLDSIFQEPEVIEHLGRQASYSKYVRLGAPRNRKYPPKEDLQRLKQYVVGEMPIVDRETGKERTIQSVDDLILLSCANIKAKDEEGKRRNTELYRVFIRIQNNHHIINSLGYNEALDRILQEQDVIEHFGTKASYQINVSQAENHLSIKRPIEEYIEPELIPLWTSYKQEGNQEAKKSLIMHYYNSLCLTICRRIYKNSKKVRRNFSKPEEFMHFSYEDLERKVDEYNLDDGVSFEKYAYSAIKWAVIRQFQDLNLIRCKKKKKTIPLQKRDYEGDYDFYEENLYLKSSKSLGLSDKGIQRIEIKDLMSGMKDSWRYAFEQHILHERTQEEIANEIGRTISEVGLRISQAKEYLRQRLKTF